MTEILIPTSLSSVHMLPEGTAPHSGPNTIFPEKGWHRETYQQGETPVPYFQKVETEDLLTIQIQASTQRIMRLDLYGQGLGSLYVANAPTPVAVSGNTYTDISGNIQQLYTHTIVFTPAAISNLKSGIYWLRATLEWDHDSSGTVDAVQYAISEPLLIRPRHENTVLIDCRHDENDEHFIWLGDEKIVSFRVDGKLSEAALGSSDESYEDSLMDASLLSSYPYRSWTLETDFIPAWLRLKLHHALGCKNFMAERRGLTKGGGSGLEVGDGNNQLRSAKATLRETAAANTWVAEFAGPGVLGAALTVFQKSFGYPYVLYSAQITVSGTPVSLGSSQLIGNCAEEANLARQFNGQRVLSKRFFGRFAAASFSGKSGVYYFPHPLEGSTFTTQAQVLDRFFAFSTQQQSVSNTIDAVTARCKVMAIQWDSLQPALVVSGSPGGAVATYTESVTIPGDATQRVWQSRVFYQSGSAFQELIINGGRILGMARTPFPAGLSKLTVVSKQMELFDCDLLSDSVATLTTLDLSNCALISLSGYGKPWAALANIDLSSNYLSSASVDAIINTTSANVNSVAGTITGGLLRLQSQLIPAPPTAASSGALTNLTINYSWTVTTD